MPSAWNVLVGLVSGFSAKTSVSLLDTKNLSPMAIEKTSTSVYLIKGKFYSNVASCSKGTYYGNPIIKIRFAKGAVLNYNPSDVVCFPFTRTVEGDFRVKDESGRYYVAAKIHIYGKNQVYGIETRKGYVNYVAATYANIESSLLPYGKPKVLDYLSMLSDISTIATGEGMVTSLRQKYDNLKYLFKGSLLASYCFPENFKSDERDCPMMVFPFGCNESQYKAVKSALENRLSVIQGPPGTGKTQTILNIVANLLLYGKSCLIVSNNNSAVSNVVEKLSQPKYGLDFLVANLGRSENKDDFIASQTGVWPDMSSWKLDAGKEIKLRAEIKRVEKGLANYFESLEKLAQLKELEAEQSHQMELSHGVEQLGRKKRKKMPIGSTQQLYKILLQYDSEIEKYGKLRWITRLKAFFSGLDITDRVALETAIHKKEYEQTLSAITSLKKEIASFENAYKGYQEMSLQYLKSYLAKKYGNTFPRRIYDRREIELTASQDFLQDYPVVTSTTFSATTNIDPLIPFDYLIMDEASQVDVAGGALALNCARAAVIVGDPKQLPNVVVDKDAKYANEIFGEADLPDVYRFVGNSFLDSILKLFPSVPMTLLKEHYRCHPLIIGFCNKQFYNDQLVLMTNRDSEKSPLSIIRSVKGNHARGTQNRRQAEDVISVVRDLLKDYEDIGIIAPYRAQAGLISTLLQENGLPALPVSTVHKFQGRENDVIILSTVDNEVREFIDDPHLLNVAVSRAKKKFILAITGNEIEDSNIRDLVDYIKYYDGDIRESQICSVFDILYRQYAEERKKFVQSRVSVSQYESENIMFALLDDIISTSEWNHLGVMPQYPLRQLIKSDVLLTESEKEYVNRSWTLVDFVLYNKTTKAPVLVIEVDGMSFHKSGSAQARRDSLKDSVLRKAFLPLLRLSTDGSNERNRIIDALSDEA